jgi:hypothetical protein
MEVFMFRKVTLSLVAAILVAGSVTAAPATAATKKISNGVACSKVNATTKVSGYSYKCAKNTLVKNSKLTWLSVECLSAIKSYNTALNTKENLADVGTPIESLDVELAAASAALTKTTAALDNAKAQIIKSRAILATTTNSSDKLALSGAVSKLANAILVLTASRSKLDGQVRDLVSKKALLASAPEQLAENIDDAKGGADLLCAKGF